MELYSTFQIKDHYYWTDASPEIATREEREAKEAAAKPAPFTSPKPAVKPIYKACRVREANGTVTYFDRQINAQPVRYNGWMI